MKSTHQTWCFNKHTQIYSKIITFHNCLKIHDDFGFTAVKSASLLSIPVSACILGMVLRNFVGGTAGTQASRWLMFAGKFWVSAAFATVFIFTAELYPTRLEIFH